MQGDTSAIFAFLLRTIVSFVRLIIFNWIEPSPHNGVIILPISMCFGLVLDWVGSTITVLPTDMTADAGNLPPTRCSLCGCNVTFAWAWLYLLTSQPLWIGKNWHKLTLFITLTIVRQGHESPVTVSFFMALLPSIILSAWPGTSSAGMIRQGHTLL